MSAQHTAGFSAAAPAHEIDAKPVTTAEELRERCACNCGDPKCSNDNLFGFRCERCKGPGRANYHRATGDVVVTCDRCHVELLCISPRTRAELERAAGVS